MISPKVEVHSVLSPSLSIAWRGAEAKQSTNQGVIRAPQLFFTLHAPEEITVEGVSEVKIWNYPYQDGEEAIIQRFTQRYRYAPLRARWGLVTPLSELGFVGNFARQLSVFTGGFGASGLVERVARAKTQVGPSGGV